MTLKELYELKRNAYAKWRDVMDQAAKEDRALTSDEKQICDECEKAIDDVNQQIASQEDEIRRRQKLAAIGESLDKTPPLQIPSRGSDGSSANIDRRSMAEIIRDYADSGSGRKAALAKIAASDSSQAKAQDRAMRQFLLTGYIDPSLREQAALRMDSDTAGGFLVVPEQFLARLIQDIDKRVMLRSMATIIPLTGAESIGVPTLSTDISDPDWTTELKIGDEDTSLVFGKRRLTPHPVAKWIKVSKELLRSAAISVEGIVRERLSYKFGTVEETAFMTGSGASQPLGLFTASASGISTSQDVSTGNTDTTITTDGLINCKYKLESQWLASPNLRWVFHRDVVSFIRKLKDGNGQYIWTPGLRADAVDTILEVPVLMSEYAPNTFTTTLYLGLIGDLSYYWIADNMSLEIQRLVELYAGTNQDAFVGRMALDGMPVLEKAFARVTLA